MDLTMTNHEGEDDSRVFNISHSSKFEPLFNWGPVPEERVSRAIDRRLREVSNFKRAYSKQHGPTKVGL